jgi:hypothetical protein
MFIEVQVHSEMHNKYRKVCINIDSIETFFDNIIVCKGKEGISCKETYGQIKAAICGAHPLFVASTMKEVE